MPRPAEVSPRPISGLAADVAELARVASRDRWGLALIGIGWVHLAVFLACHALYARGDRSESHFLPLWGLDLSLAVAIFRRSIGGRSRRPAPPMLGVVVRIWATFLILCFSTASLNQLVGFETDWFKAVWGTLATFGFATMAWLLHPGFLIAAVQMSLTALLIARNPDESYLIYGLSWCLALNGVGLALERRRALALAPGEGRDRVPLSNAVGQPVEVG